MGVSYEYFVHKHVIDDFDELLREHERATEGAYNAFRATTARDVFTLLGNIASNSAKTPTLFDPPREATSEVVFSTDRKFYERLVGGEKARAEAVEVLAPWLESQSLNLRFLGSDFVGLLRLSELAPRLRELAAERQKHWKALSEQERSAVLNFWWAASACDDLPYQSLKMQLLEWQDPFVQKWILFVARQMPDGDLAHLVKLFLRTRAAKVRRDVLEVAISAIEALHHSGFDMRRTVHRHRQVFEAASFWDEACASVSAVPAEVRPRNWRSRTRRFLGLE